MKKEPPYLERSRASHVTRAREPERPNYSVNNPHYIVAAQEKRILRARVIACRQQKGGAKIRSAPITTQNNAQLRDIGSLSLLLRKMPAIACDMRSSTRLAGDVEDGYTVGRQLRFASAL